MSTVIITVTGEHEARITPERGIVHASIRAQGPERGEVVERMARYAAPLREDIIARKDAGTVADWASERVAVWVEHPVDSVGHPLPPVHHASVDITVTFADFTVMSFWVGDVADRDGVQIGWIDWQLTPETRTTREREIASLAVGAAVARAHAYAAAIGRTDVTPLEIADAGLLGTPRDPSPQIMTAASRAVFDSAGPAVDLRPEAIVVRAAVDARFSAA